MFNKKGQISIGIAAGIFFLSILLLFIILRLPVQFYIIFIISALVFATAFVNTDFALVILILAMLFSPEIKVGGVPGRAVVIRADDIFLIVIFFGWLAKMAINKELGLLRATPLNQPILFYINISIISTFLGVLSRQVSLKTSIFYLLKYLEYYLLFFMVSNNIRSYKQVKVFVSLIIVVAFIISAYAWVQHFSGVERVTAPFEGEVGEANTLGGYLILIIMLVSGLLFNSGSRKLQFILVAVLTLAFPALLFTLSRGSWFSFLPAVIILALFTGKGKPLLLAGLMAVVLLYHAIFPSYVQERVKSTFAREREYSFFGRRLTFDESTSARIDSFKYAYQKWIKKPVLGHGVGSSVPVIDNQYSRVIIEVGTIGLIVFLWILGMIFRVAVFVLRELKKDTFASGLTAGFIAGFVGLILHAFTAETFILIRIMEPFWFLTAIVVTLPRVVNPSFPETVIQQKSKGV